MFSGRSFWRLVNHIRHPKVIKNKNEYRNIPLSCSAYKTDNINGGINERLKITSRIPKRFNIDL